MVQNPLIFHLILIFSIMHRSSTACNKTPNDITKPKSNNNGGRHFIEIPGKPENYIPLQKYNISIKSNRRVDSSAAFRSFMLTIESKNDQNEDSNVGQLTLDSEGEMLTRISPHCPNTVVDSNTGLKSDIQVFWTAPPSGSGCVQIRAIVVESKENWYSDDEWLTKTLCEETLQNENVLPNARRRCCTCDEAKYEMAFEGKWTRNTHPRHFPVYQWKTKFSDIIGASHRFYHAFWKYDDIASEGLKELAETGVTKTLESELKNNSENIRTIIKARGLQYPNITKSTYAVFRVDNKNHLVSLVAKIIPSPDWVVGVSSLELCREDCTWEESRTLNLYPWDIGTNDGLNYEDSIPNIYKQPIKRITPNNPNDINSPFYDEKGEDMKPLAKLHLTRQRVYKKTCELDDGGEEGNDEDDCTTTDWSGWRPCYRKCGNGNWFRVREYVNEDKALQCNINLIEVKGKDEREEEANEENEGQVQEETHEEAEEQDDNKKQDIKKVLNICGEGYKNCEEDSQCPGMLLGGWSPCSVTCGKGIKSRMRIKKPNSDDEEESESHCPPTETAKCEEECSTEDKSTFGDIEIGNSIIVSQGPVGDVVDCKVSKWSPWSECLTLDGSECGNGYRIKTRKIKIHQTNGGRKCPKDLMRTKDCYIPCRDQCIMGKWTQWTPCSQNCGSSAVQIRTREIIHQPSGVKCPARVERKPCHLPLLCTEDGKPIINR